MLSVTSHDSQAVVPSLWRPLGVSTFRNLLLADIASDVGTFMQSVGAAWLMVSLNAGPLYVALTQTASSLPFFIFALPAGAIGDIVDRRKLILFTEVWMAGVAIVLATVTISGLMVGTAFAINAASFLGVILVVARWRRHPRKRTTPAETLSGATAAAIRYVRYSPGLRALLFRAGIVMFFASGLLALLPAVAHEVSKSPTGYGFLLGSFGFGAVLGALAMQRARARWSAEAVVSGGVLVFGLSTMAAGMFHNLPTLNAAMLIAGAAWIVFISLFNVITLNHTPDWVRARVLAVWLLVFQGAMAGGSAVWGALATRTGIHVALIWAGAGTIATAALGLLFKLPDLTVDLTPWVHWKLPIMSNEDPAITDSGPALVTVEYDVEPEHQARFLQAVHKYERIRRRDGAYQWGIFRNLESPNRYVEMFLVDSWAEHMRQHERSTHADREVEERVQSLARGTPKVHHLVRPTPKL